jgi:hypothetical protein
MNTAVKTMQTTRSRRKRGSRLEPTTPGRERGFAYLMALFLIFAVIVASQVAAQNLVTAGRRDREDDMIWRGNQYARAIRLYYRKAGHYPKDLEELQKGLPDLHFLRAAAYKDPMNANDGEWGFIYVNPTGQLFGSSRYASLQQMALIDLNGGKLPAPAIQGAVSVSSMGSSSSPTSLFGPSGTNSSSQAAPGISSSPATTNPAVAGMLAAAGGVADQKPTGPVDGPVLGAFLTGVVSKSSQSSVKVYNGGKKYNEWEFIWNPLEDQARAAQSGLAPQGAVPGQPGQPAGGIGSLFGPPPGQATGNATGPTGAPPGGAGVPLQSQQ